MHPFDTPGSRAYARLTGIFYLTIAFAGVFSILWVPSQLHVVGDMAATMENILGRRGLFNLGIGGDVVVLLAEIMVTAMLYFMFKPVSATLSFAAALARLSMVAVMSAMLFFHVGLLALAEASGPLAVFGTEQRAALGGMMLAMHDAGVWIWQVFFTLHLAILGQLVARSGQYPRLLGHAMTLGAIGYILDSLHSFALPDAALLGTVTIGFLGVVTLAEFGFSLWLIIRGPRTPAQA